MAANEEGIDFLNYLGEDVSTFLLSFLPNDDDKAAVHLVRLSSLSHSWRRFVVSNRLCKRLCLKLSPETSSFVQVTEISSGGNLKYSSENETEWQVLEREHIAYSDLSHCLLSPLTKEPSIMCAVAASSTDRYPVERISNTLSSDHMRGSWETNWSSAGNTDPTVPETLTYRLKSNLCILYEIHIKPFAVYFHYNNPIYSAKEVRFRMGYPKPGTDFRSDNKSLVEDLTWTYISPTYPMLQQNTMQVFSLPHPILCIGGILQIELLGRVQKCHIDEMYYFCIGFVQAIGCPLWPGFDVSFMNDSGNAALRYLPRARLHLEK